ncbi:MAG TPA: UbiA family prenyltransferase [Chroococcales cyanobacterium]|jgi:4-hydroxybenzoate polyprenyltransferase
MPSSILSLSFWKAYGIQARPYLLFVSGAAGIVGLAFSALPLASILPAVLLFFLTYGLGQALTDVFQTDTDKISSPYRPLSQGIITPRQVLWVSLVGLLGCAGILFRYSHWAFLFGLVGVVGLATYTPLKRKWWGGPIWNSWIVALLTFMAFLCGNDLAAARNPRLWLILLSVFCSYAVFVILGYFKDISADRQTAYDTLPVHFGWRPSVFASAFFGAISIGVGLILFRPYSLQWLHLYSLLWLAGAIMVIRAHVRMFRISNEAEAHPAIADSVRAFILLHLGEAVTLRPDLLFFSLAFYAIFEIVLYLRPEKSQI